MSPKLRDWTNHRCRLLARGRGFEFGGRHFFTHRMRWHASPQRNYGSACSIDTVFLQSRRKPKDKKTSSEENKQFDPVGIGGEPPPWKAAVLVTFSFQGGTMGLGAVACVLCFVLLSVRACLLGFVCYYQVIIFQRAETINGDANQVADERTRRASIFLPINPLKMAKINSSRFDVSQCLGSRTVSGYSILSKLVYAGNKAWHTQPNPNNLRIVIRTQ